MATGSRPNVVLLHCHDLGHHLGCYGADVETPNVDRIAREGHRMANHFCAAPLCSPARGALHTGRYPPRNGLIDNCVADTDWSSLGDDERTLAVYLGDAGYHTTLLGHQMLAADAAHTEFDREHPVESAFAHDLPDGFADFLEADPPEPFLISAGFHEVHRLGWN